MKSAPYFVYTFKSYVAPAQGEAIDRAVKAIDPSMDFVCHNQAGNDIKGWLERPNDGTNDYPHRKEQAQQCVLIAKRILAKNFTVVVKERNPNGISRPLYLEAYDYQQAADKAAEIALARGLSPECMEVAPGKSPVWTGVKGIREFHGVRISAAKWEMKGGVA